MNMVQPHSGLPVAANPRGVAAAAGSHPPETAAQRKLEKAAESFETMLISELWKGFQSGVSSLTGESRPAGSDTLNSMATQAMAAALAHRGALGIAKMIVRQLGPRLNHGGAAETGSKIKIASSG